MVFNGEWRITTTKKDITEGQFSSLLVIGFVEYKMLSIRGIHHEI